MTSLPRARLISRDLTSRRPLSFSQITGAVIISSCIPLSVMVFVHYVPFLYDPTSVSILLGSCMSLTWQSTVAFTEAAVNTTKCLRSETQVLVKYSWLCDLSHQYCSMYYCWNSAENLAVLWIYLGHYFNLQRYLQRWFWRTPKFFFQMKRWYSIFI